MEKISKTLKETKKQILPSKEKVNLYTGKELSRAGWAVIPNQILMDKKLLSNAKLLWATLYAHSSPSGSIFPGQDRLANILNISSRQIRTLLNNLKKESWITIEQRGLNKTNLYTIVFPEEVKNPKIESLKKKLIEKDKKINYYRKRFDERSKK